MAAVLLTAPSCVAHAQDVIQLFSPAETSLYSMAAKTLADTVTAETEKHLRISALEGSIAAEFAMMREWSAKYNGYLKQAEGFASTLKAAAQAYEECVGLFANIIDIGRAASSNREGVLATFSMSDIYAETATELVTVFTLLDSTVATGGEGNMLTGEQRLEVLWELDDHLRLLNGKFRKLAISLRCYTLIDVWDTAVAGMADRDAGDIAGRAISRWSRAATSVTSAR